MKKIDKLRQRRMERIRQLQEMAERKPFDSSFLREEDGRWPKDLSGAPVYSGTDEYAGAASPEAHRWNDPEYVWKRKWSRDFSQYPTQDERNGERGFMPTRRSIRIKLFISCALFALVWGLFQSDYPMANKGKAYILSALNEPFDFRPVAMWYERQFGGTPTLLPALNPVKQQEAEKVTLDSRHYFAPVKGKVIAPYEASRLGVTVETGPVATVAAMDTGLVVYAGSRQDTGYTVIIRHAGGMQSVYGWIEQGRVQANDWIKGGETIGSVSKNSSEPSGYLYFAVSKDNKFVNPADVVSFD